MDGKLWDERIRVSSMMGAELDVAVGRMMGQKVYATLQEFLDDDAPHGEHYVHGFDNSSFPIYYSVQENFFWQLPQYSENLGEAMKVAS